MLPLRAFQAVVWKALGAFRAFFGGAFWAVFGGAQLNHVTRFLNAWYSGEPQHAGHCFVHLSETIKPPSASSFDGPPGVFVCARPSIRPATQLKPT